MKKMLEAALVLATLALGVYVVRQAVARRDAADHPAGNPALRAGPDVAKPGEPYVQNPSRAAQGLPMIKLSRPPKQTHRSVAVPSPESPAP